MLQELIDIAKKLMPDKKIDWEKVNEDSSLKETLGLDSIAFIMLSIGIEEKFGVEVAQNDANSFKTVGDILKYIEDKK